MLSLQFLMRRLPACDLISCAPSVSVGIGLPAQDVADPRDLIDVLDQLRADLHRAFQGHDLVPDRQPVDDLGSAAALREAGPALDRNDERLVVAHVRLDAL